MKLSLIVAMSEHRVIGKDGKLPWHLSDDLKRFKALTMGHPIIMGRKTHESIGRVLPGRDNIILTRNADYEAAGARVCASVQEALDVCGGRDAFVIGGESIYRLFLDRADRIYMTQVHQSFEGDAFFPPWDETRFKEIERDVVNDSLGHTFLILEAIR